GWLACPLCLEKKGGMTRPAPARRSAQMRSMKAGSRRTRAVNRIRALLAAGVKPCVPTITNSIGMLLALIPPGTFWMGSPPREAMRGGDEHLHEVEITRPFYLGVYAVTQEEYQAVTGKNPSYFSPSGGGKKEVRRLDTNRFPVETVSWNAAEAFCQQLSEREAEKKAGRVYGLPTEAEWEYACRAAPSSWRSGVFHFGNALSSTQANFDGNHPYGGAPVGPALKRTCAVGSYPPNAFGL